MRYLIVITLLLASCTSVENFASGGKTCTRYGEEFVQVPYCSRQGNGYCESTSYRSESRRVCQAFECKSGYVRSGDNCLRPERASAKRQQAVDSKAKEKQRANNRYIGQLERELERYQGDAARKHGIGRRLVNSTYGENARARGQQLMDEACDEGYTPACLQDLDVKLKDVPYYDFRYQEGQNPKLDRTVQELEDLCASDTLVCLELGEFYLRSAKKNSSYGTEPDSFSGPAERAQYDRGISLIRTACDARRPEACVRLAQRLKTAPVELQLTPIERVRLHERACYDANGGDRYVERQACFGSARVFYAGYYGVPVDRARAQRILKHYYTVYDIQKSTITRCILAGKPSCRVYDPLL